ncbi:ABC transporter permease [Pseudoalteromonas fenneropenaei]|uniref:ABC transporter permease n=1 Tax=Pseudoalteromonas fenneropenaei TaxID=1737459 RepID=A0ABV7CIL6_9GAMM
MFAYYLKVAWLSIRTTPLLSILIVLTIAVGIAAAMTTYTVNYMMSKDPLPGLGDRTFIVQLNSWGPEKPFAYDGDEERVTRFLTFQDAHNLLAAKQAKYQTAIGGSKDLVYAAKQSESQAQSKEFLTVTVDFFTMFKSPFLYGMPWSSEDDAKGADVVVISKRFNDELFDGKNSLGENIMIGERLYRIVGVLDTWPLLPKFYGSSYEAFQHTRDVFIPFYNQINNEILAKNEIAYRCWKSPDDESVKAFFSSECTWIYFWVQLESAEDKQRYMDFIYNYANEQRKTGRFQREGYHKLRDIQDYLTYEEVVSKDSKIGVWLAFLFLFVCLLNCMSLMTAKFHAKAAEIGLRRAIGASKQDLFIQYSCEMLLLGGLAALCGLLLSFIGLHVTKEAYSYLDAELMQMNATLIAMTVLLTISATLLFGLLPIRKAINIQPASQLKSL